MNSIVTDAGAPAENYYSAINEDAINATFANIINEITNALGYKNVIIDDGMTDMTASAVINGDPDSFTYTRSGGSYGTAAAWSEAPAATYENGHVEWNLGGIQLENNVTYTVSFKVWPKQEAYDLAAALNNGVIEYDDLTAEQQEQFVLLEGGGYGVKTNTGVTTSYTQIETITTSVLPEGAVDNGDGTYSHDGFTYVYDSETDKYVGTKETPGEGTVESSDLLEPMALTGTTMQVEKKWVGGTPSKPVRLALMSGTKDDHGNITYTDSGKKVTLDSDNNWKSEVYISPGVEAQGEVLEPGHYYTLIEEDLDYHYELSTEVVHPMIVDGTLIDPGHSDTILTATNTKKKQFKYN